MGFRFRKSINLGKGFRINMSKSGPGFSWGGKGFRITRTANGNIRGSAYIPGTGIGYQKDFGNPHKKITGKKNTNTTSKSKTQSSNTRTFDNDLASIHSDDMKDVLAASNKNRTNTYIAIGLIAIGILLAIINPLFVIISVLGVIFWLYNKNNQTIRLDYEMSEDARKELEVTNNLLEGIMESDAVWLVTEAEDLPESSGADMKIISRENISYFKGNDQIETNAETFTLDAGQLKLIFLPDSVFIKKGSKMSALSFNEMKIDLGKMIFLEDQNLPADATVLGKTYEHVNKDGSPDKRYKENPQINLVEYGYLSLKKAPGFDIFIVFSDTVLDGE